MVFCASNRCSAKSFAAPDRPGHRRGIEGERLLDLVEQIERIARLAVHLVMKVNDRNVTQAADPNSLRVRVLDPLAASITMMAESTAVSVR